MKRLLPRHLLLASGILLLVIAALFIDASSVLDIHLHDTYYIIAHQQLVYAFGILSLVLWALHWFCRRLLFFALAQLAACFTQLRFTLGAYGGIAHQC